jgi:predicted nucleic acid-binding protein
MESIENILRRMQGKSVYFDTNPIIYFINKTPLFFDICLPIFKAIELSDIAPYSGELCLSELLVKPLRDNDALAVRYLKDIFDSGFITLLPHNRKVLEFASSIRASQNLKMIDAIHVATAMEYECDFLITGDQQIAQRITGIEIVNLSDYLYVV